MIQKKSKMDSNACIILDYTIAKRGSRGKKGVYKNLVVGGGGRGGGEGASVSLFPDYKGNI